MRFLLQLALAILVIYQSAWGAEACFGPEAAKHAFVYFHGMDEAQVGEHERRNRELLDRLATSFSVRIAVARGNQDCNGKVCWNHSGKDQAIQTVDEAIKKGSACIGKRSIQGLIGFSNGGYLISKYFQTCSQQISYLITGALGDLGEEASGKNCGHLVFAIGRRDQVYHRARALHQTLSNRFPKQVSFKPFAGGHDLDEGLIRAWIKEALAQK